MAKSPRRRANSRKPQRRFAGQAGSLISVMISSCSSDVVSAPTKKSSARITREPFEPVTAISASQVTRNAGHLGGGIGMRDAAADGATIADLVVRNVLDGGLQQAAWAVASRASSSMSRQRTMAPSRTPSARNPDLLQLGQLAQSRPAASARQRGRRASASGSARRRWRVPPRHGRQAARPLRTSVAGQAYSSGGSFMMSAFGSNCAARVSLVNYHRAAIRSTPRLLRAAHRHRTCNSREPTFCAILNVALAKARRYSPEFMGNSI